MLARPPILVLQHHKENQKKCSLSHLRGRPDIEFRWVPPDTPAAFFSDIRGIVLGLDASELVPEDREILDSIDFSQLVIVDGTWAKISSIVRRLSVSSTLSDERRLVLRSLPESLATAYPRRSKLFDDPTNGLASVEALMAAVHLLNLPIPDLLDGYRWKEQFLALNREFLEP